MKPRLRGKLRRDVTLLGSFSFGYADVGAGVYLTLGLVAQYAGPATPLSFMVASLAYLFTALCYAELASSFPEAGGGLVYSHRAFGKFGAFCTGWALMLDYVVTTAIFALAAVGYLGYFLRGVREEPYFSLAAFLLVFGLVSLNYLGVRESARFSTLLVVSSILGVSLVIASGLLQGPELFWRQIVWGSEPKFSDFLYGTSIAMASFLGIEVISQTAEETKIAGKTVPRAIAAVSLAVVVVSVLFSSLAVGIVPWRDLAQAYKDPAAVVAERLTIGYLAGPIIGLLGLMVCTVATNTGVVGASRMAFAMSRERLFPSWLGVLHGKYGTPYRAIVLFGSAQLALAYIGHVGLLADLYNFGALLAYMSVALSLIVLRKKEPSRFRPFKIPFSVRFKMEIPIPAVLAFIFCGAVWGLVIWTHELGRIVGFSWMAIGLAVFLWYNCKLTKRLNVLERDTEN